MHLDETATSGAEKKMKPTQKCQNLQLLKWLVEDGSKSESIPIDPHVKMPNSTAEINPFTAWYKDSVHIISDL